MKYLPALLLSFLAPGPRRRDLRLLLWFLVVLAGMVVVYSVLFHLLMLREGRQFSWVTGAYWTLTVMSTLGFGDITFTSDLGRLFSMWVLLSGLVFLLILLPFTFINFFYAPWMEAQALARTPREVSHETSGHLVLTSYDAVTASLINRLTRYHYPYVLLVADSAAAARLQDLGLSVLVGDLDHPGTYQRAGVERAALVAATNTDPLNTSIAFTVRELSEQVPIIATANDAASVDILELAGASYVLQLGDMLGKSLARRVTAGDAMAHVIGQFDQLLIAEATPAGTPLLGQTLRESGLRQRAGISVVGVWDRGQFATATPDTRIGPHTVLVLAGSQAQLDQYNRLFSRYNGPAAPVVIIGGGRVGRATGRALAERGIDYRIVEQLPERIRDPSRYVLGNAAELEVLRQAGIDEASAVVITTHNDDTNVYLTVYCRRLRPDIQIIGRATLERNISTLHRAGTDFVMSYASMGANIVFNFLQRSNILMVAEGLDLFRLEAPAALVDKTIAEAGLPDVTGCSLIAIQADGAMQINPDPATPLAAGMELILIGSVEDQNRFLERYRG